MKPEQNINNDNALHIVEKEWLHGAASNPDFQFLADAEEAVYSLADGKALK